MSAPGWEQELREALCIYCRRGIRRYRGDHWWMHAYHDPDRDPERERYAQCLADPKHENVKGIRALVRRQAAEIKRLQAEAGK